MIQPSLVENWIPYRLSHCSKDSWNVKWMDLGDRRMTEPFFDETIQACCLRQRERSAFSSLSDVCFLSEVSKEVHALEPSAFVFHVSRCGSTLISQAFSQADENIVVAEAPLLDEILRAAERQPDISVADQEVWFRAAIKLMGQKRNFKETDYIIKLDSWHLHFYELLRQWYPRTPFFFLYRRPDEVLSSHDRRRGIHAIPGMIPAVLVKADDPGSYGGDFSRYTARVLEQYYVKMQDIARLRDPYSCFVDFAVGVSVLVERFSSFTGIPIRDKDQVKQRLGYHSKASQEAFIPEAPVNKDRFFFKDCQEAYERLDLQVGK